LILLTEMSSRDRGGYALTNTLPALVSTTPTLNNTEKHRQGVRGRHVAASQGN